MPGAGRLLAPTGPRDGVLRRPAQSRVAIRLCSRRREYYSQLGAASHILTARMSSPLVLPPPYLAMGATIRRDTVLVVAGGARQRARFARRATEQGHLVLQAADVPDALRQMQGARPDLVLVPGDPKGLRALEQLRANPDLGSVAAIVLTRGTDLVTLLRAFELGADDVIAQSVGQDELAWRMRARLDRRAIPRDELVHDPVTGALTQETLARMMRIEFERVRRTRRTATFAYLALDELPTIEAELGQRARDTVLAEIVDIVTADGRRVDLIGYSRNHLALVLPDTSPRGARIRLHRLAQKLYHHTFVVHGREIRLTPVIGFAAVDPTSEVHQVEERAWTALLHAAAQLDLYPVEWLPGADGDLDPSRRGIVRRAFHRHRTALQVGAQQLLCVGLPLLAYATLDRVGLDVTGAAYLAVVIALAFTALSIWIESVAAYRTDGPPDRPAAPYPAASAIIAAYLPNEAAAIVETVRAFLRQDYQQLQVILAYNTPHDLPVEDELRAIAAEDPRLVLLRIRDSVSKAQNVNAALSRVTGEFVGVFDADHHPARGSFKRAWRWIASGVDVVQGHCVVRNGNEGYLQQLVTSEFESIYAVAHPGRARVHGFGIFGGSNGYWKTPLLRRTRMRGFMLTEDIDSSMRVDRCRRPHRVGSWPHLDRAGTGRLAGSVGPAPALGAGLVAGLVAPPLHHGRQRSADSPSAVRPCLPARLARDLSVDLPPGVSDPGLLVPSGLAAGRLVRAHLRVHHDLHHERGRHAVVDGVAASPPGSAAEAPLVRHVRAVIPGLLHRVQERDDQDRAPQRGHARATVEGDAPDRARPRSSARVAPAPAARSPTSASRRPSRR